MRDHLSILCFARAKVPPHLSIERQWHGTDDITWCYSQFSHYEEGGAVMLCSTVPLNKEREQREACFLLGLCPL
jgi:hypothetical protein